VYRDYFLRRKRSGVDDREDHLFAAFPGDSLMWARVSRCVTLENAARDAEPARMQSMSHESAWQRRRVDKERGSALAGISQLVLAADQFIVTRHCGTSGRASVIGVSLVCAWGRGHDARAAGWTWRRASVWPGQCCWLRRSVAWDGPNTFPIPAAGQNNPWCGVWDFEAVRQYFAGTGDETDLQKTFPVTREDDDAQCSGPVIRFC